MTNGAAIPATSAPAVPRGRYTVERRKLIVQTVRGQGRVDAAAMAGQLQVSTETIRKDLLQLERGGLLRRVHGGAITRTALAELPREGAVFLDAGSTTTILAEMFPADRDLTVFTNTLTIALALVNRPRLGAHTLGGRVRARTFAEVDNWAIRALSEIRVDVAFLGTNSISSERGLGTADESEAIKWLMLSAARRRILLADHTKYDRTSLFKYGNLSDIDVLITGGELPERDVYRLEAAGMKQVIRA